MPEIFGTCDERFAPVRHALADNFRDHGELGAAVAIAVDGQPVVDIWAGWKDSARTRPWERDTLVAVFSVGKAMAALCVLLLVERGEVDLDAPVARYWPEFAAAGKGGVTVRTLLAHRAGLPAVRGLLPDEAIYDWDRMAGALAAEEPWWEPGSTHGYHVNTLGFLAGEIVRRVAGRASGPSSGAEVGEPLGADFHFGFGAEEDHRVAEYTFGSESTDPQSEPAGEERQFLLHRVYLNPPGLSGLGTVNTRAVARGGDPVGERARHGTCGGADIRRPGPRNARPRRHSSRRSPSTPPAPTSSSAGPRVSGSAFSSPSPSGRWVPTHEASATSASAAHSGSQTQTRGSRSPTR